MSIFSQITFAMPYILVNLAAPQKLIHFWAKFSEFIQDLFNPRLDQSMIKDLQTRYQELMKQVPFFFFLFFFLSFFQFSLHRISRCRQKFCSQTW